MKILQVAPAWVNTPPNDYGGTEWVIANLVKGLSELGHDVTLFATGNSGADAKIEYVFKRPLLEQGIGWDAALPAMIHYHQAFQYAKDFEFVHAHLASATDLILLPFLADLTEQGIPNLLTIHSRWPFDRSSNMDEVFLNLYGSSILAVNISGAMHATLPKQFRDGGFVHNSLDITKMEFNPRGGKYFTWLGRIIPEKGIAEAIRIAKMAGEQLIFAGIIEQHNVQSVRYWIQQVKPLIDGSQIQYLGPADLKLKNKLLGGAKAFLNPLQWEEPFGMVLVESMACGTPLISYNRGAISEVVKHGESGLLVRSRNEMFRSLDKVGKISRYRCRTHVEEQFSPKSAALKYANIYRKEVNFHKNINYSEALEAPVAFPSSFAAKIDLTSLN
ncbi:glycosyltransferase family 4 protein [Candidatus Daviesbacteria bacterium]|nr:glycosyltransferase family 4 protein [Candidatus Daviesbacteria bacterium]